MLYSVLAMALAAGTPALASGIDALGSDGPLRGTMSLPTNDAPIILMIPGSGPTDRDGNSPLGVNAAPYRLLAEGLAEQGIGSVRIDKRGMFGSKGAVPDANAVTIADYVHDTGPGSTQSVCERQQGASCFSVTAKAVLLRWRLVPRTPIVFVA